MAFLARVAAEILLDYLERSGRKSSSQRSEEAKDCSGRPEIAPELFKFIYYIYLFKRQNHEMGSQNYTP